MAEMEPIPAARGQWTCGKGLAEQARVPTQMAEFLEVLAENLEAHVPTIDTTDAAGRAEREAYVALSAEYAALAARLARTAERMRGYRDLPAARHHEESLADPGLLEAFERFVAREQQLVDLLAASVERDGEMLRHARAEE